MTSKRLLILTLAAGVLAGCDLDSQVVPCNQGVRFPTNAISVLTVTLDAGETCAWPLHVPNKVSLDASGNSTVSPVELMGEVRLVAEVDGEEFGAQFVHGTVDGVAQREPGWLTSRPFRTGEHVLRITADRPAAIRVTIRSTGEAVQPDALETHRSLQWNAGSAVASQLGVDSIERVMSTVAEDGHGGRLLADWLDSFAETAHSTRAGPAALADRLRADFGAEPLDWDLDALPFTLTAIENRLDLAHGTNCGELRLVYRSELEGFERFHMAFQFEQAPAATDLSPLGTVTCLNTANRWAALSTATGGGGFSPPPGFETINPLISRAHFIGVRTHEAVDGAAEMEFRQWVLADNPDPETSPDLPQVLTNEPMFQAIDVERLNAPGEDRESFLTFVAENAAALDARTQVIPEEFLALSTRASESAWVPLDLTGVPAETLTAFPDLRKNLEVVGCAGCHLAGNDFTHTAPGALLPFLADELEARLINLGTVARGDYTHAPFGPLQEAAIEHLP